MPASIATLLAAGIRVWVITGDKQETAINIAISCKLIRYPDSLLVCNADSAEGAMRRLQEIDAQLDKAFAPVGKRQRVAPGSCSSLFSMLRACMCMRHAAAAVSVKLKKLLSSICPCSAGEVSYPVRQQSYITARQPGYQAAHHPPACTALLDKHTRHMISVHAHADNLGSPVHPGELVIDGGTLSHVLGSPAEELLASCGARCGSVVICRSSPAQKAAIVKMMEQYEMLQVRAMQRSGLCQG